jgi:hypothetical protein
VWNGLQLSSTLLLLLINTTSGHLCQNSEYWESNSIQHSWLITGFVTRLTRWVSLEEQELLTLPEQLSSPPVFSGVRVTRSLVLCVCFVDRFLYFYFGHNVLSVLRYTDSDYPFGIFKLFLTMEKIRGKQFLFVF